MRIAGNREAQRLEKKQMTIGVLHMIVSPDNMCHSLLHIVVDVGQMEHGTSVAAHNNEILHAVKRLGKLSLDQIVEKHLSADKFHLCRSGDHLLFLRISGKSLHGIPVHAEELISRCIHQAQILESGKRGRILNNFPFRTQRLIGHCAKIQSHVGIRSQGNFHLSDRPDKRHRIAVIRQLEQKRRMLFRRIQIIRFSLFPQLLRGLFMLFALSGLIHDLFIVVKAEPFHAFEEFVDRLLRGAFQVGIFNPQQECPFAVTGGQPVEDCRPDVADVDLSGGGGGEARSEIHLLYSPINKHFAGDFQLGKVQLKRF